MAVPGSGSAHQEAVARYEFPGTATAVGEVTGRCLSYGGFAPSEEAFTFQADDVRLVRMVTWVNQSAVRPGHDEEIGVTSPFDRTVSLREQALPGGSYRVQPGEGSVVVLWPLVHPERGDPGLLVTFNGTGLNLTDPVNSERGPANWFPASGSTHPLMNGLRHHDGAFPATSRTLTMAGSAAAEGNATLQIRDVTLHGPRGTIVLPKFATQVQNASAPADAVRVTTWRLEEAFVRLVGIRLTDPAGGFSWACSELDAEIEGSMTMASATGTVELGAERHDVVGQHLTLVGSFGTQERPDDVPGRMTGVARGDIHVVGVDFKVAGVSGLDLPLSTTIGMIALLGVAVAILGKKGAPAVGVLYARIQGKALTEHPIRRQIVELLGKHRGASLSMLAERFEVSRGTLRHHVDMLERDGSLWSDDQGGERWVYRRGVAPDEKLEARISADERLRLIRRLIDQDAERQVVVQRVCDDFGVSSRHARRLVQAYLDMAEGQRERAGA